MLDNSRINDAGTDANLPPMAEWIKPEVTRLDLETAQQTGIPG